MTLPKPYYEHDGITIYHGDCREILPHLPRVDLVLTDPPYGVGKAEWDDGFLDLDFMKDASEVFGVMPGVSNIVSMTRAFRRSIYRWTLCAYISNGMTRGAFGFGNWIPLLVYAPEELSLHKNMQDHKQFSIGREAKPEHPSPKPIEVIKWFVDSLPGEVVLDPFMGSGTTLRAAKDLRRKAIGIEIEEKYCEIAAKRLEQEVFDFA